MVSNTLINEETGETTELSYDETSAITKSEYYDPVAGELLTTVYENDWVASRTLLTTGDGKIESVKIEYCTEDCTEDSVKKYTCVDYNESANNRVETTVGCLDSVAVPDNVIGQSLETQPDPGLGVYWCSVTHRFEHREPTGEFIVTKKIDVDQGGEAILGLVP